MVMRSDIEKIITSTLAIPIKQLGENLVVPCAVLQTYLIGADLFGDGSADIETESIQIDLFYKKESEMLSSTKRLVKALDTITSYPSVSCYYDSDTKLFRADIKTTTQMESEV